jgi:hypothetical protein
LRVGKALGIGTGTSMVAFALRQHHGHVKPAK